MRQLTASLPRIFMKKLFLMVSIIGVLLLSIIFVQNVVANGPENVYICHYDGTSGNFQTLNISEQAAEEHLEQHELDYEGACEEASPTPTPTPTPGEEEHYACVENACTLVEGEGQNTCESNSDCEEATPTPTQTPNVGGPGDGRSDGLSSCPSCTQAPPTQAVLGLSTTSSGGNGLLSFVQLFGALALSFGGFSFFKKNA